MIIKLHNLAYFKENFYKDEVGDWWESKEMYKINIRSLSQTGEDDTFFYTGHSLELSETEEVVEVELADKQNWEWAVKEYVTEETHPEYFL